MTVYFVEAGHGGPVKIGYTRGRAEARVDDLQGGNPFPLRLLSQIGESRSYEQYLHAIFGVYHIRGEWFRPVGRLRAFLDTVAIPLDGTAVPPERYKAPSREMRAADAAKRKAAGDRLMDSILAQFESDTTKERTAAGMARAKENKSQVGRRPKLTPKQYADMEKLILSPRAHKLHLGTIAHRFRCSTALIHLHFPAWRSKTAAERKAWRKAHPLPTNY